MVNLDNIQTKQGMYMLAVDKFDPSDLCDMTVKCISNYVGACTLCPMAGEKSRDAAKRIMLEGYTSERVLEEINIMFLLGDM